MVPNRAMTPGWPTSAFTAFDSTNKSNIVESYLLLEPDACTTTDSNGEIKTVMYREIVQMKQEKIVPIFQC